MERGERGGRGVAASCRRRPAIQGSHYQLTSVHTVDLPASPQSRYMNILQHGTRTAGTFFL
jgi:hypothetical protein